MQIKGLVSNVFSPPKGERRGAFLSDPKSGVLFVDEALDRPEFCRSSQVSPGIYERRVLSCDKAGGWRAVGRKKCLLIEKRGR